MIPDNTELPPCACSGSRSRQRQPLTSSERTFPRSCRRWHHRLPSHLCQLHSPHSPQQPLRDVPGLRPGVGVRQGTTCHRSRGRIRPAVGLLTHLAEAGPAPGWGVPATLVSAPIKMEPAAVQGQTSGGRAPRPRQSPWHSDASLPSIQRYLPAGRGHPQVQRAEFLTTNGKQGLHSSPRHPHGRPNSSSDSMTEDEPGSLGGWQTECRGLRRLSAELESGRQVADGTNQHGLCT